MDGHLRRGRAERLGALARLAVRYRSRLPRGAAPRRAAAALAPGQRSRTRETAGAAAGVVAGVDGSEPWRVDVLPRQCGALDTAAGLGLRRAVVPQPLAHRGGAASLEVHRERGGVVHRRVPGIRAGAGGEPGPLARVARRREADGHGLPDRSREVVHLPALRPVVRRWLHQLLLLRVHAGRGPDTPDRHRAGGCVQPRAADAVRIHADRRVQRGSQPGVSVAATERATRAPLQPGLGREWALLSS